MASLNDVNSGDTANSSCIQQVVDVLKGTAGSGNVALSVTAVNDNANYALSVKNSGTGGSFRALDSSASMRLALNSSGPLGDPDGTGLATLVTATHTQTLTNKTLTNAVLDGTVTGTGVGSGSSQVAQGSHTHAGIGPFSAGAAGVQAQNSTAFYGPAYYSATESAVQVPLAAAATFSKLYVQTSAIGGVGQTVTVTLRKNGVDTAITCSVVTGALTGNDVAHSATFAAGDLISLKVVTSATTGNVQVSAGLA